MTNATVSHPSAGPAADPVAREAREAQRIHSNRARGGKYLTFALGREEYGLEILKVREIIGYMDVTAIPCTPPYVKGVINLRGQVISVMDLRSKFGMEPAARTEETCIIVVEIRRESRDGSRDAGRKFSTGLVVDRVREVLDVAEDTIEDAPAFGTAVDTSFILGMGKIGESVKILLDIDKVLTDGEAAALATAAATEQAAA